MSATSIPIYGHLISVRFVRRVWAAISANPHATIRELAAQLDAAHSQVAKALTILDDAGYIRREKAGHIHSPRACRVVVPFVEVRHEHP